MPRPFRPVVCRLDDRITPADLVAPPAAAPVADAAPLTADTPLDPAFGDAGLVQLLAPTDGDGSTGNALKLVALPDGRTLVLGQQGGTGFVERRLADGRSDPGFGTVGRAVVAGGRVRGLAPTPDGGAVVAVEAADAGRPVPRVVRLTPAGTVDAGFAAAPRDLTGTPTAVAVAADGRVFVAYSTGSQAEVLGVLALTPGGAADEGFGPLGRREFAAADLGLATNFLGDPARRPVDRLVPAAVAAAPDGGVVVAGQTDDLQPPGVVSSHDFRRGFLLKLTAAGGRDGGFRRGAVLAPAFTTGGVAVDLPGGLPNFEVTADRVAVGPDGRVTVGGSVGRGWYVSRFRADGSRDTTLGSGDGPAGTVLIEGPTGAFGTGTLLDLAVLPGDRVAVLAETAAGKAGHTLSVVGAAGTPPAVTPLLFAGRPAPASVVPDAAGGVLVGLGGADAAPELFLARPLPVSGLDVRPLPADGFDPVVEPVEVVEVVPPPPAPVEPPPPFAGRVVTDGPRVGVAAADGTVLLPAFAPFEATYTGELYALLADLDDDGVPELLVAPGDGGGPVVAVYRLDGGSLGRFFGIEDLAFRGGARLAAGDFDGDGVPDLVATAGPGGGPRVAVFDGRDLLGGRRKLVGDFFAFEPDLWGGAEVAAGDLNADGRADLVLGGGPGGGPRVLALDGRELAGGRRAELANYFAADPAARAGVRVAVQPAVAPDGRPTPVIATTATGPARHWAVRPGAGVEEVAAADAV